MKAVFLALFFGSQVASAAIFFCDCVCDGGIIEVPNPKCTEAIYKYDGSLVTPVLKLREFNPKDIYPVRATKWTQACRSNLLEKQPACRTLVVDSSIDKLKE